MNSFQSNDHNGKLFFCSKDKLVLLKVKSS